MTTQEFTPHASITLSNVGGIEIMVNRSADGVYYRFNHGQDNLQDEPIEEAEILYTLSDIEEEDNRAYFEHNGTAYFLDQAIKY